MPTPEGRVKDKVKGVLRKYDCYYFMPVQTGYGQAGLDFHPCLAPTDNGPIPFFIETKQRGKVPSPRQEVMIKLLRERYGAKVFVIDSDETVKELERWLYQLTIVNEVEVMDLPLTIRQT